MLSAMRIVVVLPAPLGPRSPNRLPAATSRERFETARLLPYDLLTSWMDTAFMVSSRCRLGMQPALYGTGCPLFQPGVASCLIPVRVGSIIRHPTESRAVRVITGYNTDVKHGGKVFHVQTEDKGAKNPIIETLVYVGGGQIIAS